jgi:V8-like Glu-specific endopeptidase
MKKLITLSLLSFPVLTLASPNVVYEEDNRKDVFEVTNRAYLELARSTAGMIRVDSFETTGTKNVFNIENPTTLEDGQNVCPTEKFAEQFTTPICSGFLVGPDTLVTAGHCYKSFDNPYNVCKSFAWVFDYNMTSEKHDPTKNIPLDNIYLCEKVIAAKLDHQNDFAVIKLDRKVINRKPLQFRASGKVDSGANLVVIGHPSGLPTKISDGGKVTNNSHPTTFSANIDTFQGNSGSAVFNADTGLVEGILIQGKTDYHPSISNMPGSCKVVNKCDRVGNNCSAGNEFGQVAFGEVVLRITSAVPSIETSLKAP